jgi:hypothetical protein
MSSTFAPTLDPAMLDDEEALERDYAIIALDQGFYPRILPLAKYRYLAEYLMDSIKFEDLQVAAIYMGKIQRGEVFDSRVVRVMKKAGLLAPGCAQEW